MTVHDSPEHSVDDLLYDVYSSTVAKDQAQCEEEGNVTESLVLGLEHFPDDVAIEIMSKMDPRSLLSFSLTNRCFTALTRLAIIRILSYREEGSGAVKLDLSKLYSFMDSAEDKSSPQFLFLLRIFEEHWPKANVDIYTVALDEYKQEALVCLQGRLHMLEIAGLRDYRHVPGCSEVTQLFLEHKRTSFYHHSV